MHILFKPWLDWTHLLDCNVVTSFYSESFSWFNQTYDTNIYLSNKQITLDDITPVCNVIVRSHKTQFTFIRFIFEALHLHLQKFWKETRSFWIPEKIFIIVASWKVYCSLIIGPFSHTQKVHYMVIVSELLFTWSLIPLSTIT